MGHGTKYNITTIRNPVHPLTWPHFFIHFKNIDFICLDFVLQDILNDPDDFRNFLIRNLSIPVNMTQALLNATMNGSKVQQDIYIELFKSWCVESYLGEGEITQVWHFYLNKLYE